MNSNHQLKKIESKIKLEVTKVKYNRIEIQYKVDKKQIITRKKREKRVFFLFLKDSFIPCLYQSAQSFFNGVIE